MAATKPGISAKAADFGCHSKAVRTSGLSCSGRRVSIYGSRRALEAVRASIALIAKSIAVFEPVVVLVRAEHVAQAKAALGAGIEVWPLPVEDLWCRDTGPTFYRR